MFGFDPLFDFDKNGKLDALERAAQLDFLGSVDREQRNRPSDPYSPAYDSDPYDDTDKDDGGRQR